MTFSSHEENLLSREFWISLSKELVSWREKMPKKNERLLLEAVIFLMQNPDLAPIYNKKAVYVYLRDMTGLNEKQVAINLKKIRDMYNEWTKRYHKEGF